MTRASRPIIQRALSELGRITGTAPRTAELSVRAQKLSLGTRFRAAEAASAALLAGASVADQIARLRGHGASRISLNTRHAEASLLSFMLMQFADAARAPARDRIRIHQLLWPRRSVAYPPGVRVSLARTGVWIRGLGMRSTLDATPVSQTELALLKSRTESPWGEIDYLRPAVDLSASAVRWELPPVPLGSHPPLFD